MNDTSTHGGRRTGAGRKAKGASVKVSIRLSAEQIARAKELGGGDLSAGIRAAIDALKK